jgi:myo-inositol-1(or 4)-monophosphatase
MIDFEEKCLQVRDLAISVGKFIRDERNKLHFDDVEAKGLNNFVTDVDKNAEKRIVSELQGIIPSAGFIAEEGTSTKKGKRFNWVIDPLDGTTNFIHGLFPYAVSIALMEGKNTVLGVVYEAGLDECFYAFKGGKAYMNEKEIHVSSMERVADSLVATGFPYTEFSKMNEFFESLDFFMKNSHGLRRLGSAATDLAYVACGRFEAFYEYYLNPWDVAAGAYIVQQAGGQVTDFSKKDNYIFGGEIIASNTRVHDEFHQAVNKFLK